MDLTDLLIYYMNAAAVEAMWAMIQSFIKKGSLKQFFVKLELFRI